MVVNERIIFRASSLFCSVDGSVMSHVYLILGFCILHNKGRAPITTIIIIWGGTRNRYGCEVRVRIANLGERVRVVELQSSESPKLAKFDYFRWFFDVLVQIRALKVLPHSIFSNFGCLRRPLSDLCHFGSKIHSSSWQNSRKID